MYHRLTVFLLALLMVAPVGMGQSSNIAPGLADGFVQVQDASRTWLHGSTQVLDDAQAHIFTVHIEDRAFDDQVSVELILGTGGSLENQIRKGMTFVGDSSSNAKIYEVRVPANQHQGVDPEHTVVFQFETHYLGHNTVIQDGGQPFHYTSDRAAPRVTHPLVNGGTQFTGSPTTPLNLHAPIQDAGGVTSQSIQWTGQQAQVLPVDYPHGIQLPRGIYDATITATDAIGHTSTKTFPDVLRIGTGAPAPIINGVSVSDGTRTLHPPTTGVLRGGVDQAFTVHLDQPLDGEELRTRLYYSLDGSAPTTSGNHLDLGTGTLGIGQLSPGELPIGPAEVPLRFFLETTSSYFPSTLTPATGAFTYILDNQAPRIGVPQHDQDHVYASGEPFRFTVPITDAAMGHATFSLAREGQTHSWSLINGLDGYIADIPDGLQLPAGRYDLTITATDELGHAATRFFSGGIVVGDIGPTVIPGSLTVTGARTLQASDLDGSNALQHAGDHKLRVRITKALPVTDITVEAILGEAHGLSHVATTDTAYIYEASISPQHRGPDQGITEFTLRVSTPHFPEVLYDRDGEPFAYIEDGQAPILESLRVNGASQFAGPAHASILLEALVDDVSPLAYHQGVLYQNGVQVKAWNLNGDETSLANGLQVPRGKYTLGWRATDQAGNSAQIITGPTLYVSDGPPRIINALDAVGLMVDGSQHLNAIHTAPGPVVRGDVPHQHHALLEPALPDESVEVTLNIGPGGTLHSYNANALPGTPQRYEAHVPVQSFFPATEEAWQWTYTVTSNLFGSWTSPTYHALLDNDDPRIHGLLINGLPSKAVRPTDPVTFTADLEDLGSIHEATLTIQAPSPVTYTLNPGSAWTRTLNGGVELPDGTYDVRVKVTDAVGHQATRVFEDALTIDDVVGDLAAWSINGDTTFLGGTGDFVRVHARFLADDIQSATWSFTQSATPRQTLQLSLEDNNWTALEEVVVPEGAYQVRIEAVDSVGNTQQFALTHDVLIIDNTKPVIQILPEAYPVNKAAARQGDVVTVTAIVSDAHGVDRVTLHDGTSAIDLTGSGHRYTGTITAPIGNGPTSYWFHATDVVGNTASAQKEYVLDNTPPVIQGTSIAYLAGDNAAPGERIEFVINAADDHSRVARIYVDARNVNSQTALIEALQDDASTRWRAHTHANAATGTHVVPIIVRDVAGNQVEGSVSVIIREAGPAIKAITFDDQNPLHLTGSRLIDMQLELYAPANLASSTIVLNGVAHELQKRSPVLYGTQVDPALPDGSYDAVASVLDAQGRTSSLTAQEVLVIDSIGPRIRDFQATTPTGTFQAFFGDDIDFHAFIDGAGTLQATLSGDAGGAIIPMTGTLVAGNYQATHAHYSLGVHTATLSVRDQLGRSDSAQVQYEIVPNGDIFPGPVQDLRVVSAQNDTTPDFAWSPPVTGGPIYGYSVEQGTDTRPDIDTLVTQITSGTLQEGDHEVTVRAINTYGNWGPPVSINFTIVNDAEPDEEEPVDDTPPEDEEDDPTPAPSITTRLVPQRMPTTVSVLPRLQYTITGSPAVVECVVIEVRKVPQDFAIADPCATSPVNAFSGLEQFLGSHYEARGRLDFKDNSTGPWVSFGKVLLDNKDPAIAASPAEGEYAGKDFRYRFNITDDTSVTGSVRVIRNGQNVGTYPIQQDGQGYYVDLNLTEPGNYQIVVEATDASGNKAVASTAPFAVAKEPPRTDESSFSFFPWGALLALLLIIAGVATWTFLHRRQRARELAEGDTDLGDARQLANAAQAGSQDLAGGKTQLAGDRVLANAESSGKFNVIVDGTQTQQARRLAEGTQQGLLPVEQRHSVIQTRRTLTGDAVTVEDLLATDTSDLHLQRKRSNQTQATAGPLGELDIRIV